MNALVGCRAEHFPWHILGVLLLVVCLGATTGAWAQETTGTITGTVTDQSGGVVPDVNVVLTHHETNQSVTVRAGSTGIYTARELKPGRYTVIFEKPGFSRFQASDVVILVGRTTKLDAAMQVGTVEQTVSVSEAATLIDTTSTMIAHNVTAEAFDRLPKGRNFIGIANLASSVNTGAIEGGFQVNGASGAENNYYIDGVSTTSILDGRARQAATFEYLQEVQVKTSGMDAEYGGALGGVISGVTKSGGNDFHGEIHYYHSGSALGVGPTDRLNLDPVDEQTVRYVEDGESRNRNHEFGASLGGPLLHDRLFFFTSFSPRWHRFSRDYRSDNGASTNRIDRESLYMSWFNKLSFNPHDRVRTNFQWLYTPTRSTGTILAYDGAAANVITSPDSTLDEYKLRGYSQPEQSYSGNIDVQLSATSLLSVRGGRYYLNFKNTGVSQGTYFRWMSSSVGLAGLPADLQRSSGYNTGSKAQVLFDITTSSYLQADFSQFFRAGGTHTIKAGVGTRKNVNKMNDSWYGPNGYVRFFWDTPFSTGDRGQYGYYEVHDAATAGSTGASITHLYIQDNWRVHPRLSINLGLRSERETIPSFARAVKDYAFQFAFGDKLAPRFGASFDVLGNGKVKLYGSWGRYYDWTKLELSRGTFGADVWHTFYRSLDTLDVFSINAHNLPGRNLWTTGQFRDWRKPGFQYLDDHIKPMSADILNFGFDYEIRPQTVFSARYVRNHLNRTIEDMGALDAQGNEQYRYGNPGEGAFEVMPVSGATCVVKVGTTCATPMPKPKRDYNALELELNRRFANSWLANVSYTYSRLTGNYAGLQSTDEIRPTGFGGYGANQQAHGDLYRPGGNVNRYFDLDEALYDSHGNLGLYGRLPTDRPHVLKFYGSKMFGFGTEVGGIFRVSSGTPVTTQVLTINHIPVYVNGRGDLGRTPVFSQTDLLVAHEIKFGEVKRLRLEMNMDNLFNQQTAQFIVDRFNREDYYSSSGMNLSKVDLSKGFDFMERLAASSDGIDFAKEPRFGKKDLFNPGFAARFGIKFIF